jgi:DNA-binding response OmpR family regulator
MRAMLTPPIIILAEPDPMISGVLRVEFSRWDFAVLLAGGIREAESFTARAFASLVVLDTVRDGLAAFEACARIRRRQGYGERPILMTASDVSARTRAAAATAGASALVSKPYSLQDLFAALTPHVPANDPLLTARARPPGMAAPPARIWDEQPAPAFASGRDSALTRTRLLLPIVRASGESIPLVHDADWAKSPG